jgi:hypothetical protein
MKITILTAALFFAVNVTAIFAFGGVHDSLLFDGESQIKDVQSFYAGECSVKIKYASGKNNGVKHAQNVMTDCSGKVLDTLNVSVNGQLKKDDILYLGEEVSTGDDGVVEIELWDGSTIRMAPNTTIKITREFCETGNIFLIGGKIWNKIKKLIGGAKFEVSFGPDENEWVVGVRGTEFAIEVMDSKYLIKVYESAVEVTPRGSGDTKGIEDAGKEIEKLTEDLQNGKITPEEFTKKSQEYSNSMQEKSNDMTKSVVVETGYTVTVTDKISTSEQIPSSDFRWFEDANFYK